MTLPSGWRLRLDPSARRTDGGTVLIGGAPLRLLRLNAAGAAVVDGWERGEDIGTAAARQALARRLLDLGVVHPVVAGSAGRVAVHDVTVVIPVFPDAADLPTTLRALGPVAARIVVDDATGDPEVARVAAAHGAACERHDVNQGPAAARNTGWHRATTDVVAFIDPNCTPDEGWIDRLLPHFDDPAVAAVAPRITSRVETSLPPALQAYERERPSLDRGPTEGAVRPRSRVPFVPTAALLVRRSALEDIGGFDEALRLGEDVDLVWRLVEQGATVRYDPSVEVTHGSRRTTRAWLAQRYRYGGSTAMLAARHGPAVAPLAVSGWTAGAWALVGLGFPVAGVAVAGGSSAMLAPKLRGLAQPWVEAARLAGLGNLYGGWAVADALRRPWWPLAVAGSVISRRARRAALAAAVVPPLIEWWKERPGQDPVRWTALRLADDIAYGAGVWRGCLVAGSWTALIPTLPRWPGRKPVVERADAAEAATLSRRSAVHEPPAS